LAGLLVTGCYKEIPAPWQEAIETPDWTPETHGIRAAPDYEVVFHPREVKRLEIVIEPEDWADFKADMKVMYGEFGGHGEFEFEHKLPDYIPCNLYFEGKQWYKVGIRAKGNVPLGIMWTDGRMKFPFKLDFDEFEDRYPAIRNQRFYGFRQLSLKNAWGDPSLVREGVINELFREAGLPVARSAYYAVYLNYGEGEIYSGLYTLVEDVDDTVLPNYFEDPTGHLYKPEEGGAHFNKHEFPLESFEIHSDSSLVDYLDVKAMHRALHSDKRLSDPLAWEIELNNVFDTRGFLRFLACNRVVANWDVYGAIAHNYYLYNDPLADLLVWIPWDHDNGLKNMHEMTTFDFQFSEIGDDWPLIRYLIDNQNYKEVFRQEVEAFINGAFHPDRFIPVLNENLDIVAPFAQEERLPFSHLDNPEMFHHEREVIIGFAVERYLDALEYVRKEF